MSRRTAFILIVVAVAAVGAAVAGLWWYVLVPAADTPSMAAPSQNTVTFPPTEENARLIAFRPYQEGISPEIDAIYELYAERFPSGDGARPPILVVARFDLNLDGVREIFVNYASDESCNDAGCELALFTQTAGQWRKLQQWMVPAESAYILPFAAEGWNGLAFGPGSAGYGVWRMGKNGKYVLAGVSPTIPGRE